MIIESSSLAIKSQLAKLLVNYRVEPLDREGAALDIIEFIALGLRQADDDQVFNLALFVSRNLAAFAAGTSSYIDVHTRLARAAMAARLGCVEFLKTLDLRI